jgi:hypothetical protein
LESSQDGPDWQFNRFHASETSQYRAVWVEDRLPVCLLIGPAGRRSPNPGKPVPASSRFCKMYPSKKCPGICHISLSLSCVRFQPGMSWWHAGGVNGSPFKKKVFSAKKKGII